MSTTRRSLLALALMTVGLIALIVGSIDDGWSALTLVAVVCLVVAIGAQALALGRARAR